MGLCNLGTCVCCYTRTPQPLIPQLSFFSRRLSSLALSDVCPRYCRFSGAAPIPWALFCSQQPPGSQRGALSQARLRSISWAAPQNLEHWLTVLVLPAPPKGEASKWAFPPKHERCWLEEGADMVETKLLFKWCTSVRLFLALRLSGGSVTS